MALFDRSQLSLQPAELTLLLQRAEPQALAAVSELRAEHPGVGHKKLAQILERQFVTKPKPEETFGENAAVYVSTVAKLYDKELALHGNNTELLGTVLNVAQQIDRAEEAVAGGASKLSELVAKGIPFVQTRVGKHLPDDVNVGLTAFHANPTESAEKATRVLSSGAEVAAAAIIALATRRVLSANYGIALEPPKN